MEVKNKTYVKGRRNKTARIWKEKQMHDDCIKLHKCHIYKKINNPKVWKPQKNNINGDSTIILEEGSKGTYGNNVGK